MPDEESNLPVSLIPPDAGGRPPEAGAALCLSGGGYRAMLFHVGSIWRLYEAGILQSLSRVSSVSGGSITAAQLGLCWRDLSFAPDKTERDFIPRFVGPLRRLASRTIDRKAIVGGALLPGSIGDRLIAAYRKHLFADATLQDLPGDGEGPRFVINATNVQSGALWRFSRPYMRDWRVGEVRDPQVPIATAVAASSAFPPVLSPIELELESADFTPGSGADLQREPFTREAILTDGGVYDNLGLETAYKRYQTLFVSDAGGKLQADEDPDADWARHSKRVLDLIDNQVRSLRKRQLIGALRSGARTGAYWGIRTDISDYRLPDPLPAPIDRTTELAETPTRLKHLDDERQERLINWGYAVADAAIRAHVDRAIPRGRLPYRAGV
jgi:NTE family protein